MKDFDTCNTAIVKIKKMKYIKLFGNWIVDNIIYIAEIKNKITFLHREHNHHLYNSRSHKNHFLYQSKWLIKRKVNLI